MRDRKFGRHEYYEKQHINLLHSLKQSIKLFLCGNVSYLPDDVEHLSAIKDAVDNILTHGLYYQGPEKYWNVIRILRILTPDVAPLILPSEISGRKDIDDVCIHMQAWLAKSLTEHSLSKQIEVLSKDTVHLKDYYKENAFLRHASCVSELLKCLHAFEQNEPVLLDDPFENSSSAARNSSTMVETPVQNSMLEFCDSKNRFVPSQSQSGSLTAKQNSCPSNRCSDSSPDANSSYHRAKPSPKRYQHRRRIQKGKESMCKNERSDCNDRISSRNSLNNQTPVKKIHTTASHIGVRRHSSCPDMQSTLCTTTHKIYSLPNLCVLKVQSRLYEQHKSLYSPTTHELVSEFDCDNPELQSSVRSDCEYKSSESSDGFVIVNKSVDSSFKAQHLRSKSDGSAIVDTKSSVTGVSFAVEDTLSSSLPSILLEEERQKRKSIFEGGTVVVPTECFFPRPHPGQTLMSFLSSDFNICAELDRENAHFCISEALISAIEQIKCTETLKLAAEEAESDEEIKKLTQRIRIRRRERLQEKVVKNAILLSDGRTDTTTTSQSASPMSTSHSSDFGAGDSIGSDDEDVADLDISDQNASNLTSMKESGLSLSLASMYSDADIHKGPFLLQSPDISDKRSDDPAGMQLSAEVVALSLLKRFSEKQLPKASDLEWLVSEQDAPQRLLPLPDSWPVSPDVIEEEFDLEKTRLRGNLEWAPPRQQIIFIIHQKPIKKDAILKQDYRCAGCGMRIEKSYVKKFRYCEYLGKFFCQCCHANNLAYIPGRILWKWDFGQYYVSKFSWKLLDQMFHDPLFNVMDINPKQYRKIRQLGLCRDYRMQLFYLKDFIRTCRDSKLILKEIEQLPEHIYNEPHLYSISDFLKVKSGDMSRHLSNLVLKCTSHIMQCILCQGKGFICEMCNKSDDIIFPFQLAKVCHCSACGCCFHKRCFKDGSCPKCVRIKERKRKLQEQKEQLYSDEES